MRGIFARIYRQNLWQDPESVSGRGSTVARTGVIRSELPRLLNDLGAKSLLDIPCGDFNWLQHVDLTDIAYTGADVVPALIARNNRNYASAQRRFIVADITKDKLPLVDVVMTRDCFIHLSLKDIHAAIANLKRSGSTYLLATTHTVSENVDIETGGWRSVNLRIEPFSFPEPEVIIAEDTELGKHLGLWRINAT